MMMNLAVLIATLSGPTSAERAQAAEALARLGEAASAAAVNLVSAMADESEAVREWATAALEQMGPPPAADLGRLVGLLAHTNPDVAYWAATLLGRLEKRGESAANDLAAALTQRTETAVRQRAAWALGRIGASSPQVVAALQQASQSDDPRLARLAKQALAAGS